MGKWGLTMMGMMKGKGKAAAKAKGKAAKTKTAGKGEAAAKAKGRPSKQHGQDDSQQKGRGNMKRPAAATAVQSAKPKPNRVPVHNFYKRSTLDVYWSRTAVGLKLRGTMQQASPLTLNVGSVSCPISFFYMQVFYLAIPGCDMQQLLTVMYSVAAWHRLYTCHAEIACLRYF